MNDSKDTSSDSWSDDGDALEGEDTNAGLLFDDNSLVTDEELGNWHFIRPASRRLDAMQAIEIAREQRALRRALEDFGDDYGLGGGAHG